MKRLVYLLTILVFLPSCKNRNQIVSQIETKEDFFYSDKVDQLPEKYEKQLGDWLKVGTECYGVIAVVDEKDSVLNGFPIPCKVISFHSNGIKCKTTSDVFPYEEFGCNRMGVKKGENWLEEEGNLFKTEEEAIEYLKTIDAFNPSK